MTERHTNGHAHEDGDDPILEMLGTESMIVGSLDLTDRAGFVGALQKLAESWATSLPRPHVVTLAMAATAVKRILDHALGIALATGVAKGAGPGLDLTGMNDTVLAAVGAALADTLDEVNAALRKRGLAPAQGRQAAAKGGLQEEQEAQEPDQD